MSFPRARRVRGNPGRQLPHLPWTPLSRGDGSGLPMAIALGQGLRPVAERQTGDVVRLLRAGGKGRGRLENAGDELRGTPASSRFERLLETGVAKFLALAVEAFADAVG